MLKNLSKDHRILLLVIVGLFLLMFDQNFALGDFAPYGEYETSYDYNGEFQYYTINYNYGADFNTGAEGVITDVAYKISIDIFPDIIGFLIMAFALKKLGKYSKIFNLASFMSILGGMLYIFIHILPFLFNGMPLVYMGFWGAIAIFGMEVITSYVFVFGICDTLKGHEHSRDRKAIVLAWFATIIINGVVMLLRWLAAVNTNLLVVYEIIQLGINLLFFYFVLREREYIVKKEEQLIDEL